MNAASLTRALTSTVLPRPPLDWVLIHGPVRTGTSLMKDLVAQSARREISDWGLGPLLVGPRGGNARVDVRALRRRISRQLLRSAPRGGGSTLDLVYKQANLTAEEHQALVDTWGAPDRTVFCFREPAAFLASARRKFPDVEDGRFWRDNYEASVATHRHIGGDIFVYGPNVTVEDYARFLTPLSVRGAEVQYRGAREPDAVPSSMWSLFEQIRQEARAGDLVPPEGGH